MGLIMNTFYLIELAIWYVVFAWTVIRLHRNVWRQKPGRCGRWSTAIYLFLFWWFAFPFMVDHLVSVLRGEDDE